MHLHTYRSSIKISVYSFYRLWLINIPRKKMFETAELNVVKLTPIFIVTFIISCWLLVDLFTPLASQCNKLSDSWESNEVTSVDQST